jgi:hypothetical protein
MTGKLCSESTTSHVPVTSSEVGSEVDTFLAELKTPCERAMRGRLIFALDATASRQPTWDAACELQAEMFREGSAAGLLPRLGRVPGVTLDLAVRAARQDHDTDQLRGWAYAD